MGASYLSALEECIRDNPEQFKHDQLSKVYVKAMIRAAFPSSWRDILATGLPKKQLDPQQLALLEQLPVASISNAEFCTLLSAIQAKTKQTAEGLQLAGTNVHARNTNLPYLTKLTEDLKPAGSKIAALADMLTIVSLAEHEQALNVPISTQFQLMTNSSFPTFTQHILPQRKAGNREERIAELCSMLDLLTVDFSVLPNGWGENLNKDVWNCKTQAAPRVDRIRLEQQISAQVSQYSKLYSTTNFDALSRPLATAFEDVEVEPFVFEESYRKSTLNELKKVDLQQISAALDSEIALLEKHQLSDAEALQKTRQRAGEIAAVRRNLIKNAVKHRVYAQPGGKEALEWHPGNDFSREPIENVRASVLKMEQNILLLSQFQIQK